MNPANLEVELSETVNSMRTVKLSLCLTKQHAMKAYWGEGIVPRILNLGTRRRCVVSFTHRPLYPQGKITLK